MADTSISWTDKTWNCIRGCSRVSEGCRHCYAERNGIRFNKPGEPYHGLVTSRLKVIDGRDAVEAHWTGKVLFLADHLCDPIGWRKPQRVFVNSVSDVFHDELTNEQIAAMFGVMAACPQHQFQVLTKRAQRMREWFAWIAREAATCNDGRGMTPAARCFIEAQRRCETFYTSSRSPRGGIHQLTPVTSRGRVVATACERAWPLSNVWMGVSVEDQAAADERVAELLGTPAAIRFLSCEPLLGRINLRSVNGLPTDDEDVRIDALEGTWRTSPRDDGDHDVDARIDWVIAGAESGPRARPCDYRWLRQLRDQCKAARVAFFLKQAALEAICVPGRRAPQFVITSGKGSKHKPGGIFERPYLDGVQHLQFPAEL